MSSHAELVDLLQHGLSELHVPQTPDLCERLLTYVELLARWNQAFNLSGIRDVADMVVRHLFDSLSIYSYIRGQRVLDIGSGAGLPGIPLALVFPERQFVLLDSNQKKTRFLQQASYTLALSNVQVAHTRLSHYHPETRFDTLLCRAFSSLHAFITQSRHLGQAGAQWLAMKGTYPRDELPAIQPPFRLAHIYPLHVPLLQAQRHLVEIDLLQEETYG